MVNCARAFSQSESGKYFERIIKTLNTVTMCYLVLHFYQNVFPEQRLVWFHILLTRHYRVIKSPRKQSTDSLGTRHNIIHSFKTLRLETNDRQTCKYRYVARHVYFSSGISEASSMDGGSRSAWETVG